MNQNWYEYLKEKIKSEKWTCGNTDCAFMHGQVTFAWIARLITDEEKEKLNDMIPEY